MLLLEVFGALFTPCWIFWFLCNNFEQLAGLQTSSQAAVKRLREEIAHQEQTKTA
jgi:hypothetical protein